MSILSYFPVTNTTTNKTPTKQQQQQSQQLIQQQDDDSAMLYTEQQPHNIKLGKRTRHNNDNRNELQTVKLPQSTLLYSLCTYPVNITLHVTSDINDNNIDTTQIKQTYINPIDSNKPIHYRDPVSLIDDSIDSIDSYMSIDDINNQANSNDETTVNITADSLLGQQQYIIMSTNATTVHNTQKQYQRNNKAQYRVCEWQNNQPLYLIQYNIDKLDYQHQIKPINVTLPTNNNNNSILVTSPALSVTTPTKQRTLSQPLVNNSNTKPAILPTFIVPTHIKLQLDNDESSDGYCICNSSDNNTILSVVLRRNVASSVLNLLDDDKQYGVSQQLLTDMFNNAINVR